MGLFINKKANTKTRGYILRASYELKPYEQLGDDLEYAHHEILYKQDGITVSVRKMNETLCKVTLVDSKEKYAYYELTNEALLQNHKGQNYNYGFKDEYLNLEKMVHIIIFKQSDHETILLARELSFSNRRVHQQAFVYNPLTYSLESYSVVKSYNSITPDFWTCLFFDLAAIDPEVEA